MSLSDLDMEHAGKAQEAQTEVWTARRKELWIMLSLALISLMVALDATILVTVLPEIALKLNGSSIQAFWVGTSYLLVSAVVQPPIAAISSLFGRQQLLLTSVSFFALGTVLCGTAADMAMLLVGRCIQGIGGGGIITLTQVIFSDIVPLRQRPKYFAIAQAAWAIGTIIGPIIGGTLVHHASWRWCFHINYPLCGIGLVVAFLVVRLDPIVRLSFCQKLKRMDWLGAILFLGSMTLFLVGVSWAGIQFSWLSAATWAPITMGVCGLCYFTLRQRFKSEYHLLPQSVFASMSTGPAFYVALVNGLVLFIALYYYPFYEMSVRGSSPLRAGTNLLSACVFVVPGSIITSVLITRFGVYQWAIWGGWLVTALASGLWILFDIQTHLAVRVVSMALFGVGTGMAITSVNTALQAMCKEEDCVMASCMYAFFRSLGMPLGVAIAGNIFQNVMSHDLSNKRLPTIIAHESESYILVLHSMTDSHKKAAIIDSYMKGIRSVFVFMTACAGSALVISLMIKKFSLDKVLAAKFTAQ